ncbi:CYTH domain-containing protein [Candidatus Bathyarchaeota archaeon]|nr:CYTH domain-containing protein [Candidatus Bathyarchaeota archaeon]
MIESEIAYIIVDDVSEVLQDIGGITTIMDYDIMPRRVFKIKDSYFDTNEDALKRKKINLRVRKTNSSLLLTMKSKSQHRSGRGVTRKEIELEWSYESLARIAHLLKMKIPHTMSREFSKPRPLRVLGEMGLREIQERHTNRDARNIVRHNKPRSAPLAELDIDRVTFLGDTRVHVAQLEIEAKANESWRIVEEIGSTLQSVYQGSLREWRHGKLATGIAIQRLLTNGTLQRHLEDGWLKKDGFPLLARAIVSQ